MKDTGSKAGGPGCLRSALFQNIEWYFAQNIIIVEAAHDVQTMQERQRREMLGCRHEEREM
jgi:hypothetical protein